MLTLFDRISYVIRFFFPILFLERTNHFSQPFKGALDKYTTYLFVSNFIDKFKLNQYQI